MNNNPRRQQKDIAQEKNLHHKTNNNAQRPSAIFVSLMRDWREFTYSWTVRLMEYLEGAQRLFSEKYLFPVRRR